MSDTIGGITVPDAPISGSVFPLVSDFAYGQILAPEIATHLFVAGNVKREQRFLLGNGQRRFAFRQAAMSLARRELLRAFYEARQGPYEGFVYPVPQPDGSFVNTNARFAPEPLGWTLVSNAVSSTGITLIEIPASFPTYSVASTLSRFPDTTLNAALLSGVQEIIPLVKIIPKQVGYSAIYVSDRRCTVGGQLYQARLLSWDGIQQGGGGSVTPDGSSDEATFSFGNADRVMRSLVNDVDLYLARIEFSLFHVGTTIKLDLWAGEITNWGSVAGPVFDVTASDGIHQLNRMYPVRKPSRTCWKFYNDGAGCPFGSEGALDLAHFPSAVSGSCDRGYDTANGCLAHGMKLRYGGVIAEPQAVRTKDNSSGTFGFGRSEITSVSLVAESLYDQVIPEIYTDSDMPVNCKVAAGRDEGDFYDALALVGEGPLGAYGVGYQTSTGARIGHTLDGQLWHGFPGPLGLRECLGADAATEPFSLGQSGDQTGGDFRKIFIGSSTYLNNYSAGTAFIEIRRNDEKGQQLTRLSDHAVQAIVALGLKGYVWSAPGARSLVTLTNPIWVAVNMLLRARGLRFASAAVCEQYFDVTSAIATAAICDTSVTKLVGPGSETQFKFQGIIQERKALRQWIQEVLMNCLGLTYFQFGKLAFAIRYTAGGALAFTDGNIIHGSLVLTPARPSFNDLTVNFANAEFGFVTDKVEIFDEFNAQFLGGGAYQDLIPGDMNLSGASGRSQAGRIGTINLREQLGGITAAEWRDARQGGFQTTILGLSVYPGSVVSITNAEVPGGSCKLRVNSWRLNPDYSIDIQGRTVTDSMYDLATGPKLFDATPAAIPPEVPPLPAGQIWHPNQEFPDVDDPMFDENDGSFGLMQTYVDRADGTSQAALEILGKEPIDDYIPNCLPPQVAAISAATSGSLTGKVWAAVCARDSAGKYSPPSNVVAITAGASKSVTLGSITWPPGTFSGYVIFASQDERTICAQTEVTGALPSSVVIGGPLKRSTWNLPNSGFRSLLVMAKQIAHSGVIGARVSAVAAGVITSSDIGDGASTDNWVGRDISIIGDASDESAAIWNFRVTAYNATTGALTCTPDPNAAGIQVNDALIIRTKPTTVSSTTIGDSGFINFVAPTGLTVDVEIGKLVRIISGLGRGQVRRIISNTTTVLTIDIPWDITPDSTSRFIVEFPGWPYVAPSTYTLNGLNSVPTTISLPVDNVLDRVLGVQVFTVERDGTVSSEEVSPFREIWLFGGLGLTGAALESGDFGNVAMKSFTLTANTAMTLPTEAAPVLIIYKFLEDSTGGWTVTWPAEFKDLDGWQPSPEAGSYSVVSFIRWSPTVLTPFTPGAAGM